MQHNLAQSPFPFAFPIFLVALGCTLPLFIAAMSGWSMLRRRFSQTFPFTGEAWKWQSARMRLGCNYNNCLTVGADASGLYLSVLFLIRIGHPPLFLPWQEITIRRRSKRPLFRYVELRLGRDEQVPFMIRERLAERLKSAAGPNWPPEPIG